MDGFYSRLDTVEEIIGEMEDRSEEVIQTVIPQNVMRENGSTRESKASI